MSFRRRKPTMTAPTTTAHPESQDSGSANTSAPQPLWREAVRHVVLGLAGSVGAAAITVLEWWTQHH